MHYLLNNIHLFNDKERTRDVSKSLARLVLELEDQIPHYDTIISDDASGRLVSLFLREVINRKKAELDQQPVQTYFIAGGRCNDQNTYKAIDKFIAKKKPSINKALLVTEFIETGASINSIVKKLDKYNINFDVASVSVSGDFFNDKTKKELASLVKRLRYGTKDETGLAFYGKSFTGVVKVYQAKSAHPVKQENIRSRKILNEARRDMKLLATEILKLISE